VTLQGTIVLDLIGLVLLLWVLNLVRRDRLYVAYAAMFLVLIVAAMIIISIPALLVGITRLVGAVFPVSALTLIALCFIVVLLVYILGQLTVISNRLATVVQQLAIERATEVRKRHDAPPDASIASHEARRPPPENHPG